MDQPSSSSPPTSKTTETAITPLMCRPEYHDPDYHNNKKRAATSPQPKDEAKSSNAEKRVKLERSDIDDVTAPKTALSESERTAAICNIIQREFQAEINMKEQQLVEIDAQLLKARHMLDKLRFDVVSEYYRKQEVPLNPADALKIRDSNSLFSDERHGPQMPLHPAVRKIVGKRPAPIPAHVPERTAAAAAKQYIRLRNPAHRRAERRRQQKIREQGIVIDHSKEQTDPQTRLAIKPEPDDDQPCTSKQALERQQLLGTKIIEPPAAALNASRLNNKNKFNFVVGNTSKYIGGELDDDAAANSQAMSYKWLVYVQGKNLPLPLEKYLKKVRFHLHHSYRPNDIVDVHAPPYQLTRRGWGEFPMRIQLYFQDHLEQKPVQLMHTIVLDKTMCGLHTMGAETTVEIWLRAENANICPPTQAKSPIKIEVSPLIDNSKPRTISITQNKEELDDDLFGCINKIEISGDIEKIEPTVVVSEPLTCKFKLNSPKMEVTSGYQSPRKSTQLRTNVTPTSASKPSVMYLPLNGRANQLQHTPMETANKLKRPIEVESRDKTYTAFQNSHAKLNGLGSVKKQPGKNVVFQKAGKLYIIDPLQSKLKQAQQKQQSLLKPQISLLKQPSSQNQQLSKYWKILHDHCYTNMSGPSNVSDFTPLPFSNSRRRLSDDVSPPPMLQNQRLRLEYIFNSIQFQSMRSAVEFLLRRLPLAPALNTNSDFPFVSRTLSSFQSESMLRQRCFEYLRAKTILSCMHQNLKLQLLQANGREHFWSIREIVSFSRLHGYTPPLKGLSMPTASQLKPETEPSDQLAQRVQQQLKEEPQQHQLSYASVSSSAGISGWLTQQLEVLQGQQQKLNDQLLIDVLTVDEKQPKRRRQTDLGNMTGSYAHTVLSLPPPPQLEAATQLVHDMCKDVGIELETEECVPGVAQPLALTLLAHVLQLFVEKLVRRTVANKLQQEHKQSTLSNRCLSVAANVELTLLPYDIGRVIAQCAELDFLGNSNLGVTHMESPT